MEKLYQVTNEAEMEEAQFYDSDMMGAIRQISRGILKIERLTGELTQLADEVEVSEAADILCKCAESIASYSWWLRRESERIRDECTALEKSMTKYEEEVNA